MRKISKKSKKGFLEKIYKDYTLPLVFKKNGGICVCCNKNLADGGHHIFGREKSYYHIHPDFVVPVCNWCHSLEKTSRKEEFLIKTEEFHYADFKNFDAKVRFFLDSEIEESKELEKWADNKLIEYGYKWGGI